MDLIDVNTLRIGANSTNKNLSYLVIMILSEKFHLIQRENSNVSDEGSLKICYQQKFPDKKDRFQIMLRPPDDDACLDADADADAEHFF